MKDCLVYKAALCSLQIHGKAMEHFFKFFFPTNHTGYAGVFFLNWREGKGSFIFG